MKNVKKILIRFGYGMIERFVLVAVGWFSPFPIEGNWKYRSLVPERGEQDVMMVAFVCASLLVLSQLLPKKGSS